jgi:hypothetical protein
VARDKDAADRVRHTLPDLGGPLDRYRRRDGAKPSCWTEKWLKLKMTIKTTTLGELAIRPFTDLAPGIHGGLPGAWRGQSRVATTGRLGKLDAGRRLVVCVWERTPVAPVTRLGDRPSVRTMPFANGSARNAMLHWPDPRTYLPRMSGDLAGRPPGWAPVCEVEVKAPVAPDFCPLHAW